MKKRSSYGKLLPSRKETPQGEPIPGKEMLKNAAGGYVFQADSFSRLRRFLILGSSGGTYYVGGKDLTKENMGVILACLKEDHEQTLQLITSISQGGEAPKNDPAEFALAVAASCPDPNARSLALARLHQVCRIPTHLYHFVDAVESLRGWGRGLTRGVGDWFKGKELDDLAFALTKYPSRDGWSAKDLLRKSHPALPASYQPLLRFICAEGNLGEREVKRKTQGEKITTYGHAGDLPRIVEGILKAREAKTSSGVASLVREYKLAREHLPTEALNSPEVWAALLEGMPPHALLRNLGNLAKHGLLKPFSDSTAFVVRKLGDSDALRKKRVHPWAILLAQRVYGSGRGMQGSGTWTPIAAINDVLLDAFEKSFSNITPSGKRLVLAVDISGSMHAPITAAPMSASEAAAAMAYITLKTEPLVELVAFQTKVISGWWEGKTTSLPSLERMIARLGGGGTDCAAPALWLEKEKIKADGLILYTDNESWAGSMHATQALSRYRGSVNPSLRASCVSMTATGSSLKDPDDLLTLDVVGLDASTPSILSSFVKGEV